MTKKNLLECFKNKNEMKFKIIKLFNKNNEN